MKKLQISINFSQRIAAFVLIAIYLAIYVVGSIDFIFLKHQHNHTTGKYVHCLDTPDTTIRSNRKAAANTPYVSLQPCFNFENCFFTELFLGTTYQVGSQSLFSSFWVTSTRHYFNNPNIKFNQMDYLSFFLRSPPNSLI